MNSYMRQSSIPADQLHSFLRDKQAWENAISMYQGPDPLDHWYNYICWYENHCHGDPENKFRETIERCLSLFEHSDYYKQDARLVRLWLKYIDMQSNPLHFYQVLYQRGVGRQSAHFYISWADYYESINAFKEAESVYNASFQEKAQPYAALHHAHSKFMFAKNALENGGHTQSPGHPHHPQQINQQQQMQHQMQQTHQVKAQISHHQQDHHIYNQQQHQQGHHDVNYQHQQEAYHTQHIHQNQHQHQQHNHQDHHNLYHHHHSHQQQQMHQQHPSQHHITHAQQAIHSPHTMDGSYTNHNHIPIEQHLPPAPARNQHNISHSYQAHMVQQQQQQQHQQHLHHNQSQNPQQQQEHVHQQQQVQLTNQQQPHQFEEKQQHPQQQHHNEQESTLDILTIKLPRKFVSYSYNSSEQWRPALYLEEPEDPCRQCHYAKSNVYPNGLEGCEYSPEELKAEKYMLRIKELHQCETNTQKQEKDDKPNNISEELKYKNHLTVNNCYATKEYNRSDEQNNIYDHKLLLKNEMNGQEVNKTVDNFNGCVNQQVNHEFVSKNIEENNQINEEEEYGDNDDGDEDDEEDYEDNNNEDGDDDNDYYDNVDRGYNHSYDYNNGDQSFHSDMHTTKIRFSMQTVQQDDHNKSIKIKFKKERQQTTNGDFMDKLNHSNNHNAYKAYTIDTIYQPEIKSPTIHANNEQQAIRRNGFHPYMLGQTSTPKTSTKRQKSKLKKATNNSSTIPNTNNYVQHISSNHNSNNFHMPPCSSSNSSSADYALNGVENMPNNVMTPTKSIHAITNGLNNQCDNALQNSNFNDNANYSFSSAAAALDNSNCSISSAVGRLNFRDGLNASSITNSIAVAPATPTTGGGGGGIANNHNLNNTTISNTTTIAQTNNIADYTTYQENSYFATQHDQDAKNRRLQKAIETIKRHLSKEAIDPFHSELCKAFLTKLDFPGSNEESHANYKIIQTPLPKIANAKALTILEGVHFNIDKEVGRGSYGSVYKATDVNNGSVVALKYQKPPNTWEIYICDQVLKRIKSPKILPGLMDISTAIIAPNASLIATEFSPFGSLLDINNKIRQATTKVMHESLVMHFSSQICNIIHHLHKQKIIHADIKPDNFLLMRIPNLDLTYPSLRLIDFGCAIDMTLFTENNDDDNDDDDDDDDDYDDDGTKVDNEIKFRKVIQTDGFTCIEMQEGRPWSYETDLFCIAGTVHVMLMGEYMQLQKRCGAWDIKQKLPRYLKKHVWTKFFNEMLNINSNSLPDLCEMRDLFNEETYKMDSELQKQIRTLSNILYKR